MLGTEVHGVLLEGGGGEIVSSSLSFFAADRQLFLLKGGWRGGPLVRSVWVVPALGSLLSGEVRGGVLLEGGGGEIVSSSLSFFAADRQPFLLKGGWRGGPLDRSVWVMPVLGFLLSGDAAGVGNFSVGLVLPSSFESGGSSCG